MENKSSINIFPDSKGTEKPGLLRSKYFQIAIGIVIFILLLPFLAVTGLPQ
jgi:hypothetical protein